MNHWGGRMRGGTPADAGALAIRQIFDGSGDAVFGIDEHRRITYVNAALLQVLGRGAEEIRNRHCYDVLRGDDLAECRFCSSRCPVAREALRNQPMQNFDLVLTRGNGDRCWMNVGVYSAPESAVGHAEPHVYFALRKVNGHRMLRQLASKLHEPTGSSPVFPLTPREQEVLVLTARGQDTAGICETLRIAPQTVRNHFKSIFSKLEVRSRSQAVALAFRRQII